MNKNNFVAINYITSDASYIERFEYLFSTRAHAIDKIEGFLYMEVLKPTDPNDNTYLIVSHWENEESFKLWSKSPQFQEGHKRGFDDIKQAKQSGGHPPVTSDFKTYKVFTE
jgi:heme-degrading monooxygenase HmoA